MSRLEKIVYLTKSQYNTLNTGGTTTVGGTTLNGINDDYIYITSDPFSVNDLDGVLPINRGGTGLTSIANNSMLIGNSNGEFTTINKTTSITSSSTDSEIPTAKAAYTYIYNNVLYKSGGTMTGVITAKSAQYDDSITSSTCCAINMANSNIIGLNSIYTCDTSDGASEGIHFYRDATHFDSLWMANGNIYFVPNRALGTSTNAANSEKVVRMPASITDGTALIASGTNGFTSLRGIRNNTSVGALGWTSSSTDITLVTTNTIAYWDGRYQTTNNASNLEYCKKGKFGNLAIKDSLSYSDVSAAPAAGSTSITTLGTITTGTWNGSVIASNYITHQTINQDGITGATINRYGECSIAAATAAKTVTITNGTVPTLDTNAKGLKITVKFTNVNTADNPTLNVNSKGAKNIFHRGSQITNGTNKNLLAGVCDFIFDGTQWHLVGNYYDTTYSSQTAASGGTTLSLVTTGEKYTWNNKSNLTIGSASTQAMAGNTTVTNVAITADTTTNASYPLVFGTTSTTAAKTEDLQKNSTKFYVNPSTGNIQATKFNSYTLASACEKTVATSISAADTSTALPTAAAVASFVEGKGYVTSSGVTSITLTQGAGITVSNSGTAITSTGSRTISITGMDTSSGSTTKWLNQKGGWSTPTAANVGAAPSTHYHSGSDITSGTVSGTYLGVMTGATSSAAGTKGAVPAPAAGDQAAFLQGDATWYKLNVRNGTGTGSIVLGGVGEQGSNSLPTATADNAYAQGVWTTASGKHSHAEGYGTTASGNASHSEGSSTTASGWTSHVEGSGTIANHAYQHVFGEYNIGDTSTAASTERGNFIEIVGNGTASNSRSNARTLDWEGNETISGYLCSKSSVIDASKANNNVSSALYPSTFDIRDSANRIISRQEIIVDPSGDIGGYWWLKNYDTNGNAVAKKGIVMWVNKSGTMTYNISDPDNFRSAISAASSSHTHSADDITSGTLPISRGGTGSGDRKTALNNLLSIASNPTTTSTDTTDYWGSTLGSGVYWYGQTGLLNGQPSQYGFLINIGFNNNSDKFQIFKEQRDGALNIRGFNTAGTSGWRKILDSSNWSSYCAPASHTHTVSQISNWYNNFTCTLLWTNSNVGSSFAAQTVYLSQSAANFKLLLISVRHSTGTANYQMCIVNPDGNDGKISNAGYSDNGVRTVTVSGTSVAFTVAQHGSSSTANTYCIPYKIWGLA